MGIMGFSLIWLAVLPDKAIPIEFKKDVSDLNLHKSLKYQLSHDCY